MPLIGILFTLVFVLLSAPADINAYADSPRDLPPVVSGPLQLKLRQLSRKAVYLQKIW